MCEARESYRDHHVSSKQLRRIMKTGSVRTEVDKSVCKESRKPHRNITRTVQPCSACPFVLKYSLERDKM
jgi:hypothetical protein